MLMHTRNSAGSTFNECASASRTFSGMLSSSCSIRPYRARSMPALWANFSYEKPLAFLSSLERFSTVLNRSGIPFGRDF